MENEVPRWIISLYVCVLKSKHKMESLSIGCPGSMGVSVQEYIDSLQEQPHGK